MKRTGALLTFMAALAAGEVLDRVAVRVGPAVITESAVRRHLRMQAFLLNAEPDLRLEARRKAAERLIDQVLVRRELELNHYPAAPASEVATQIELVRKARNEDVEAFARSLVRYGFTQEDLREEVAYEIALMRFVDFRFSAGVQVSEEEIQTAYDKEVVPEAKQRNTPPPAAEEARASILKLLTYRKTTEALELWLAQARQQMKIRFFEEAFR